MFDRQPAVALSLLLAAFAGCRAVESASHDPAGPPRASEVVVPVAELGNEDPTFGLDGHVDSVVRTVGWQPQLEPAEPPRAQDDPPAIPLPEAPKPGDQKPAEEKPGEAEPGEAKPGEEKPGEPGEPPAELPAPGTDDEPVPLVEPLLLDEVVASIYAAFPLLESAYRERDVRNGAQIAAWGAFDTKLKGDTTNQPVGFYRTYRHKIFVDKPVFDGGNVFAGYTLGRGQFEPWYEEREKNEGGEFKAGVVVPLLQGRPIDRRRSELFKAQLDRGSVEPEIRTQLIDFVRAGSFAYWDWVAAGENARVARQLLDNALERADALQKRVDAGDLEEIAITDNERLLASRRAKLVESLQKLRQSAIKLSLFIRTPSGQPIVPSDARLPPRFPDAVELDADEAESRISQALAMRPEVEVVDFMRERAEVDLRQARNEFAPTLDAGIVGSQDVGKPTSSKRDKSRFELEAGLVLEVPIERRKARGKIVKTEAKLAQINAKRRFTLDKIAVEVRNALTAVEATYRAYQQAARALDLARRMEAAERTKFDLGDSDLFLLNAREKQTAEAALAAIAALAEHFRALADLRAAMGELIPATPVAP